MSDATDDRLRSIFEQAVELSPSERAALLDRVCAHQPELRRRIDALLAAHDAPGHLIDVPVASGDLRSIAEGSPAMEGRVIGDFRIGTLIGSGGMGVVYRAQQQSLHREVALKLIRPGVPGSGLLRRFEREAIALARLRHPGIATIYEFGTIDLGSGAQPFLAMELIDGPDLITFAADLPLPKRLDLLARICDAVHHAHTRGIIHRDLKPDNILIGSEGQPKVLDFGIARLTGDEDGLTLTAAGGAGLLGTIAFMSPERLQGDRDEPDLRADIYALGVIGYRMLVGRMPHDLSGCTLLEAARRITAAPPLPLAQVDSSLRGDPDAIIATAMASEPERRYQSAAAMADDIRRALRGAPIQARSLGTTEYLRRSLKRHRVWVFTSLTITLALAAGMVFALYGLARAREAEGTAQLDRREAARQEAIARSVSDFLTEDLLLAARAEGSADADITVREVLDIASQRLGLRDFPEPIVAAELHATLGNAYRMLGRFDLSAPHLADADQMFSDLLGPDHPRTLRSAGVSAVLRYESGDLEGAALAIPPLIERIKIDAPDDLAASFDLEHTWCSLLIELGRYDEARASCGDLLTRQLLTSGEDDAGTLMVRSSLARLALDTDDLETAREMFAQILATRRRINGDDDVRTTSSMNNLATVLIRMERFDEAEPLLAEALFHRRRVLGEDHIRTVLTMGNLAVVKLSIGRAAEAESMLAQTVAAYGRLTPDGHPNLSTFRAHHARALADVGRTEEASSLMERAIHELETMLGPDHPTTRTTRRRAEEMHAKATDDGQRDTDDREQNSAP